jgi:hypothetical protein
MRIRSCLFCLALALFLPQSAKPFCYVPQPRLVCAEYFDSQLVVEATLVHIDELHPEHAMDGRVYTLRVNQTLRGEAAETVKVYEENSSGRASFDWVSGRRYLLFLSYAESDKAWKLDGCGNSGPLRKARRALSVIAAIKAAKGSGVIQGVVSDVTLSSLIPGVQVEAAGASGHYKATTNKNGEFRMKVPVGQYAVRVVDKEDTYVKAEFSYDDPQKVQIECGGCAQVQFTQVSRSPDRKE